MVMQIDMSPQEIRELRTALGYTQEQLADAVGVNRTAVTHWENGLRHPSGSAEKMLGILRGMREAPARPSRKRSEKKRGR